MAEFALCLRRRSFCHVVYTKNVILCLFFFYEIWISPNLTQHCYSKNTDWKSFYSFEFCYAIAHKSQRKRNRNAMSSYKPVTERWTNSKTVGPREGSPVKHPPFLFFYCTLYKPLTHKRRWKHTIMYKPRSDLIYLSHFIHTNSTDRQYWTKIPGLGPAQSSHLRQFSFGLPEAEICSSMRPWIHKRKTDQKTSQAIPTLNLLAYPARERNDPEIRHVPVIDPASYFRVPILTGLLSITSYWRLRTYQGSRSCQVGSAGPPSLREACNTTCNIFMPQTNSDLHHDNP